MEATHDDGENVQTHKQLTKYGSIQQGAAKINYYGIGTTGINGFPEHHFQNQGNSYP